MNPNKKKEEIISIQIYTFVRINERTVKMKIEIISKQKNNCPLFDVPILNKSKKYKCK